MNINFEGQTMSINELGNLVDQHKEAMEVCAMSVAHLLANDPTMDTYVQKVINEFRAARDAYDSAFNTWVAARNEQGSEQ